MRLTGNLLATAGNQKITPVSFSIDSLNETELQQLQGIDYSTLTVNEKVVLENGIANDYFYGITGTL